MSVLSSPLPSTNPSALATARACASGAGITVIEALVGRAPLVQIHNIVHDIAPGVSVYGKAAFFNPGAAMATTHKIAWELTHGLVVTILCDGAAKRPLNRFRDEDEPWP